VAQRETREGEPPKKRKKKSPTEPTMGNLRWTRSEVERSREPIGRPKSRSHRGGEVIRLSTAQLHTLNGERTGRGKKGRFGDGKQLVIITRTPGVLFGEKVIRLATATLRKREKNREGFCWHEKEGEAALSETNSPDGLECTTHPRELITFRKRIKRLPKRGD